ncbi:MAG: hypothetical protein ABJB97_04585 [Acidobacteriota bacterium]
MKSGSLVSTPLLLSLLFAAVVRPTQAQSKEGGEATRPRSVSASPTQGQQRLPQTVPPQSTNQQPPQKTVPTNLPAVRTASPGSGGAADAQADALVVSRPLPELTPQSIRARIAEAERLFKTHPVPTALTKAIDVVTLAFLDRRNGHIHQVSLSKQTFLTKGAEIAMTSSLGTPVTIQVVRANGVNTAVTVFDNTGTSMLPLLVEFPIEKGGVFRELAYYTSAHPALLSNELARSGQLYVRTMLDLSAKRLREKGVFISPPIVDVAERLCLIEHVDHDRFRLENRAALFQEVYSLFALNQLNTYRYSVSSAGAGGMVQMIPWAYNLMRQRHPGVGLTQDFVTGMRNHTNALEAMLLYMHDTWSDLAANEDVQSALTNKTASQTELLAAGYNSNAARLPSYLRRGGSGWRTLIPRETQMYLQIYKNFEALMPIKPRANGVAQVE